MNFDPQKLFIGLVDFFSILLPGALLTFLLMEDFGPVVIGDRYDRLGGSVAVSAFLFASYLLGHLVFLLGSWFDEFYDWARGYTLNEQIRRLAHRDSLLWWPFRALVWLVFKNERDIALGHAGRLRERALGRVQAGKAMNNFQWCKAVLTIESPASLASVNRFEADSKFFRCFTVVLLLLLLTWPCQGKWPPAGALIVLLLLTLSFWRYMEQRHKSTNQAYRSVITLTALNTKTTTEPEPSPETLGRSGGVVFRRRGGSVEFLLVEAKKDPGKWVLPKGRIEPGEHLLEAAVREVREEAGVWARIIDDLGASSYTVDGRDVTVHFYLMEAVGRGFRKDRFRGRSWLPMPEAVKLASYAETKSLLKTAHMRLEELRTSR